MCEKCIFALHIYDNIFRVTIDANNTHKHYVYETHTNSQCERRDISTRMLEIALSFLNQESKVDRSLPKDRASDPIRTNENAARGWNKFLSCEKVSATCAKMYVYYPISFDDRQYRLINSRTLSF